MNKFIVSSSPHFQSKDTTQTLMLDVILALTPAMIASVIIFGFRAGGYYPDDGRVLHFERIHIPPRHEAPPDGR